MCAALYPAQQHRGDEGDRDLEDDADRELGAGEERDRMAADGQALDRLQDAEHDDLAGREASRGARRRCQRGVTAPAPASRKYKSGGAACNGDDDGEGPVPVPGRRQGAGPASGIGEGQGVVGSMGDDDASRGNDEQAGPVGLHDLSVGGERFD